MSRINRTLIIVGLGLVLLATSPILAYSVEWHSRENGHLKMWWTKNGVRITEYPFIDDDILHPVRIGRIAPHKDINDSHSQWIREGKTKSSFTSAVCGLSHDFPTFEDYFIAQGTDSVSWFALADYDDLSDVEVTVDLIVWGDYLHSNPLPDPDTLFMFDAFGECGLLPGYYAIGGAGPFTGEMEVVGTTTLYALGMPGDVNGDGFVGGGDLNTILFNWGLAGATREQGDLTGEGDVGGADYNEVLSCWGDGLPPEPGAIPEPTTLGLLAFGTLGLIIRKRA